MQVEVCYASEAEQFLIALDVVQTATVQEAITASGVLRQFPAIDLKSNKVGIFSRIVSLDQPLHPGDRVEIYRPLKIDPKQARLLRAKKKT